MQRLLTILLLTVLGAAANPEKASRIQRGYQLTSETWALKYKIASSPAEKDALLSERPDPNAAAADLWSAISGSLTEDWTIPYSGFFLDLTRTLKITTPEGNVADAFQTEREAVIESFSKNHLRKPGIGPFAISLANSGGPRALSILEQIVKENPDEHSRGLAAMGAALLLKSLGDAPELMQKRLTYLRQAIISASDQRIGNSTVADIASDELYVIRYLSKGRVAPDFKGLDVAGRNLTLSSLKGKTVILMFWDAQSPETDQLIRLTNRLSEKYHDKPVQVLGITPESLDRIRELQADGSIEWNNIIDSDEKISKQYRILSRPAAIVINPEGEITYTGLPGSFLEINLDAMLETPPDK